ncbi:MAG TPA: STAS domain-containing protein [Actinomycetota bacterium]|nr:STAS domain-containing protein [Actinomycetota bacterium]
MRSITGRTRPRGAVIQLSIDSSPEAGWVVVKVDGEVDLSNASGLREHLISQVQEANYNIAVDLSGVEFMDSSGLAVLISGLRRTKEHDGSLVLIAPTASVKRVLSITGLDKVFDIYDSVEKAAARSSSA